MTWRGRMVLLPWDSDGSPDRRARGPLLRVQVQNYFLIAVLNDATDHDVVVVHRCLEDVIAGPSENRLDSRVGGGQTSPPARSVF